MAVDKLILSGSTNGRGIKVSAKNSGSPGTLIHTGPSVNTSYDEVWLYAVNSSANSTKLVVEFGGTTAPDDLFEQTIPGESGLYRITSGLILRGNATPLVIRAFQDPIDRFIIFGYVNRIS